MRQRPLPFGRLVLVAAGVWLVAGAPARAADPSPAPRMSRDDIDRFGRHVFELMRERKLPELQALLIPDLRNSSDGATLGKLSDLIARNELQSIELAIVRPLENQPDSWYANYDVHFRSGRCLFAVGIDGRGAQPLVGSVTLSPLSSGEAPAAPPAWAIRLDWLMRAVAYGIALFALITLLKDPVKGKPWWAFFILAGVSAVGFDASTSHFLLDILYLPPLQVAFGPGKFESPPNLGSWFVELIVPYGAVAYLVRRRSR